MAWLMGFGLVIGLLAAAAVGLAVYGTTRWSHSMQTLGIRLGAGQINQACRPPSLSHFDVRELDGLPAPVQRYFRAVLTEGQPLVMAAEVVLSGSFNMSATGEQWKPFTSWQRNVTRDPGFLWDAKVFLLPGVPVRVVDSYIAGEGLLRAAVLGLFTVARLQGGGEAARGELMRYLAETAWYPTALLPSQGVQWTAVDANSAHATLTDGPHAVSLLFRFNAAGLIESAYAAARGAMLGKEIVMLPWEGRWSDYQTRHGMLVPGTGEVAWLRPEGRKAYFRATVTALDYTFAA